VCSTRSTQVNVFLGIEETRVAGKRKQYAGKKARILAGVKRSPAFLVTIDWFRKVASVLQSESSSLQLGSDDPSLLERHDD
jgi:hypothetical protein